MVNEEVAGQSVRIAVSISRGGSIAAMKKLIHTAAVLRQQKKEQKAHPRGKQTVKQLIGQEQGVTSVDISEIGIKDFDRYARKYGVDYAVLKSPGEPPKYNVFFKARDADAITSLIGEYTAAQMKRGEHARPSLRKVLQKCRDIVAAIPRKAVERRKEQVL